MKVLEDALRESNKLLSDARTERQRTIEAHQSRVKQLQDKFLHDIALASSDQLKVARVTLAAQYEADKATALQQLEIYLKEKHTLYHQDALILHDIEASSIFETRWNTRESELKSMALEIQVNSYLIEDKV